MLAVGRGVGAAMFCAEHLDLVFCHRGGTHRHLWAAVKQREINASLLGTGCCRGARMGREGMGNILGWKAEDQEIPDILPELEVQRVGNVILLVVIYFRNTYF